MGSHTMETSLKSSRKRSKPKKRKGKSKGSKIKSTALESLSRNLGIKEVVNKKKKTLKGKRVSQYLDLIIKDFCEKRISQNLSAQNQTKDCAECGQLKGNLFEQTVDLCDDSVVNDSNSSLVMLPLFEAKQNNADVIELGKDVQKSEVIDLTEPFGVPHGNCTAGGMLEPTVIDISEDESKESSFKPETDEIFVIGTFSKTSNVNNKCDIRPSLVHLSNNLNNFNNLINCSHNLKRKYLNKQSVLDKIHKKNVIQCGKEPEKKKLKVDSSKVAKIGENIYVNSPVSLPSSGLRPIIIDGSNVAFVHSNSNFSCKRLEICINYFKEKGHKVTAFVPQFRLSSHRSDDPQLLRKLERQGDVILTPSKKIDGRNIVPYDDRFIVQTAALKGGIIVTRDNYNDLLKENPAWAETIKYRTLAFTWVDDVLMFPKDPLGEYGPTLDQFLRFH